jgi:hypothetical protein
LELEVPAADSNHEMKVSRVNSSGRVLELLPVAVGAAATEVAVGTEVDVALADDVATAATEVAAAEVAAAVEVAIADEAGAGESEPPTVKSLRQSARVCLA